MEDTTFTLRLQEIMELLENLHVEGVNSVNVVLAMGRLGITSNDAPALGTSKTAQTDPPSTSDSSSLVGQATDTPRKPIAKGPGPIHTPSGLADESVLVAAPPNDPKTAGKAAGGSRFYQDRWESVCVGKKVGVMHGFGSASPYVTGFSGNVHKGFKSRAQASNHFWTHYENGKVFSESGEVLGIEGLQAVPPSTWVDVKDTVSREE